MSVSSNDIEYNNQLLNEAKKTYTNQFIMYLKTSLYDGFQQIFKNSVEETLSNPKQKFKKFQENLKKIKSWNNEVIINETQRIIKQREEEIFFIKSQKCGVLSSASCRHSESVLRVV